MYVVARSNAQKKVSWCFVTRYFNGESRRIAGQNKCGTKHHGTFLVALERAISLDFAILVQQRCVQKIGVFGEKKSLLFLKSFCNTDIS